MEFKSQSLLGFIINQEVCLGNVTPSISQSLLGFIIQNAELLLGPDGWGISIPFGIYLHNMHGILQIFI